MNATRSRGLLIALFVASCSPTSTTNGPIANDLGLPIDVPMTPVDAVVPADGDPVAPCTSDGDCSASSRVCDLGTGQCVQCNVRGDCADQLVCVRHACQAATRCTGSTMCPGQVCATTAGICVDCTADRDCPAAQMCADNECVNRPLPCASDRECSAMRQVCNTTLRHCVACNADGDCAAGHYCNAASTCVAQACVPGQTSCVDATHQRTCDARGSASATTACPPAQTCRGGSCMANVCAPGATSCDPVTRDRVVCAADGSGTSPMPCPDGQSCDGGTCRMRVCVPGAATCASTSMRSVCNADGFATTTSACPAGQSCSGGGCVMQMCAPGSATCTDASTRSVCNPDGLGTTPMSCASSQRCSAGTCQALACTPGTSSCVDANTVRACSADGLTSTSLPCPGASTCAGTTCTSWLCTPGTLTCARATSRNTCNGDGLGTTAAPCPTPANSNSPACSGLGICGFSCNAGFGDCNATGADGCEVTLATSALHCGACGRACAGQANAVATCVAATCAYACSPGFGDCDGSPANGCEAPLNAAPNCGGCGRTGTEVCDGADNDCDGVIDDGCPTGLASPTTISTSASYGGTGGSPFEDVCPGGVAIGFAGRSGAHIDQIAARCARLVVREDRSVTPFRYTVRADASVAMLGAHGGTGGGPWNATCDAGAFVSGVSGRSGTTVDQFAFTCGTWEITGAPSTGWRLTFVAGTGRGWWGGSGGSIFTYDCPLAPSGERPAVTTINGRSGLELDAVGVRCGLPAIVVR